MSQPGYSQEPARASNLLLDRLYVDAECRRGFPMRISHILEAVLRLARVLPAGGGVLTVRDSTGIVVHPNSKPGGPLTDFSRR